MIEESDLERDGFIDIIEVGDKETNTCVGIDDMISMEDLSEEKLLENIELRYRNDIIYVYNSYF